LEIRDTDGNVVAFLLSQEDREAWAYARARIYFDEHRAEIEAAMARRCNDRRTSGQSRGHDGKRIAMKRYSVVWDEAVEADFLDQWLKSQPARRALLTDVANAVDRALSRDAGRKGKPQSNPDALATILQVADTEITAYFEVFPDDRLVRVVGLVLRSGSQENRYRNVASKRRTSKNRSGVAITP
jgi:hypothetical protein